MTPKLSEQVSSAGDGTPSPIADGRSSRREALRYLALVGMSGVVGALAVVAFAGVVNAVFVFVVGAVLGAVAMNTQRTTRETIGVGLYACAVAVVLVPVGWYGRNAFGGRIEFHAIEGVAGIGLGLPIILGLAIATVLAMVLAVVGLGFRRWAPG